MSRPHDPDFEPRVADWLEADPDNAPAAVLHIVLAALPSIPQRRASRVPWRFPPMSSFAKIAIAAVAVIAVGALGAIVLQPGRGSTVGSAPTPSPTQVSSPSASSPPPLTGSFTSSIHGISLAYPAGWNTQPATEPWTTGWPDFGTPVGDFLYDPLLTDHLFIVVASQPLAGKSGETWATDILAMDDCGVGEPVTVDGASGLAGSTCNFAAVTLDGRGYVIALYTSPDEAWLVDVYDRAWFEQLLTTVDLRPEDAVDTAPSPS
jgi:hypothetical protein